MDPDELAEQVRLAVCAIPPGSVATYGDVAELVGTGPRQVGRIMATDASDTPWWRVVNASGRLPAPLVAEARPHWLAEGIVTDPDADRVRLIIRRADPGQWLARLDDSRGVAERD